jgi:hypothetical protein
MINFEELTASYGFSFEEGLAILRWYDEDLGDTPESLLALFREHEDLVASVNISTLLALT